ncbi:hypothetical protein X798_04699 [Onchocerca flexuosa]|uniref:Uncharacterized protein n=1 Tax=Onchocerca flexuosa TaxID=387005 RepID=A0A238BTW5_9BILA|nr:hypothetical protein X798_04699 [Onchocerca flexuosa]
MINRFEDQNPSLLIVHIHQKADDKEKYRWIGNFVIEIGKENILLYDADYSIQARTWPSFSVTGENRIAYLQKAANDTINYKLKCAYSKKCIPCIKVSSNSGTLACNSRKKIRISTDDCAMCNMTLKVILGTNCFVKMRLKRCVIQKEIEDGKITKLMLTTFPRLNVLPKILENYMKGIGYAETLAGIEYKISEKESYMKRIIQMLIPFILHVTPPKFLRYDSDGVKILWKSKQHRFALTQQYVKIFEQKILQNNNVLKN